MFHSPVRTCAFLILFLLAIANATIASRHAPQPKRLSAKQLVRPLRELDFMLVAVGLFLFTFGMFAPINYLPLQAASVGVDANVVQYLVAILNAGRFVRSFVSLESSLLINHHSFLSFFPWL